VNDDKTLRGLVDDAAARLAEVSDSPRLDAELLLANALDLPRSYLVAHADESPDPAAIRRFREALRRRLDDLPLAYLTGEREFWSLRFRVSPDTLVPRPETELLVEWALSCIPRDEPRRIVDLGTGCGAIALAIASERPLAEVVATDVSDAALAVASANANRLALPNVEFRRGSWTTPVEDDRFDLVVSNPPYVSAGDPALRRLRHEPALALVAGSDGLDAIREIASAASRILHPGGILALEHGATQADPVAQLLHAAGWRELELHRDYAGLPRVTLARSYARRREF